MTNVNPPPFLRVPNAFISDPQIKTYLDSLNTILRQLYEKTGGQSDPFDPLASEINNINAALYDNVQVIKSATDFPDIIDSDIKYVIDGAVDMTGVTITVPSTGLKIQGLGDGVSCLTTSGENQTIFNGGGGLVVRGLDFEVTGTGSKVFDLTSPSGFDQFELNDVQFRNCVSLGELIGYRQGLEVSTSRFGGTPELTLSGPWVGGYLVNTSIVRNVSNTAFSLYKAGTSFTMSSRFKCNTNADLGATASLHDFAPVNFPNPSTLQVQGAIVTRAGVIDPTDTTITPNITADNLSCDYSANQGLQNTFTGGKLKVTTEAVTTIANQGEYVDVAGTFSAADLVHFSQASNNQLLKSGESPTDFNIYGLMVIQGNANDAIAMRFVRFRASDSTFIPSDPVRGQVFSFLVLDDVGTLTMFDKITLEKDDYVKVQIANLSGTGNLTAQLDSYFLVQQR